MKQPNSALDSKNSTYIGAREKHKVSDDLALEVLHELFVLEYDELVKVKRFDSQGSGRKW
jgi:hypothetical protein